MIEIPPDHKYAALALRVNRLEFQFSDPFHLDRERLVTRELPLAMPDHWQKWLGTLKVDELSKANLFLFAHAPSQTPEILDGENIRLSDLIHRLYLGLLVSFPYIDHGEGTLMTGVNHNGEIDVRRVSRYNAVHPPLGCHGAPIDDSFLDITMQVAEGISTLEREGEYNRTWRIMHALYAALKAEELGVRIHQCVRCIEGFILPEIGNTRRQFISRGALFIGSGHDELLGTLFDVRSAVEHLHGPYKAISAHDRMQKDLLLAKLGFRAEAIARDCIQRLFTTDTLWPYFKDDNALEKFWALDPTQRARIWGAPIDFKNKFKYFNSETAKIQLTPR
ncbi:MAG: hypothetical protein Q8O92_06575 [Candidatus Latescibacter sp.]|nr:hypothetical protein [Candidatus Latescibacter sp.]